MIIKSLLNLKQANMYLNIKHPLNSGAHNHTSGTFQDTNVKRANFGKNIHNHMI